MVEAATVTSTCARDGSGEQQLAGGGCQSAGPADPHHPQSAEKSGGYIHTVFVQNLHITVANHHRGADGVDGGGGESATACPSVEELTDFGSDEDENDDDVDVESQMDAVVFAVGMEQQDMEQSRARRLPQHTKATSGQADCTPSKLSFFAAAPALKIPMAVPWARSNGVEYGLWYAAAGSFLLFTGTTPQGLRGTIGKMLAIRWRFPRHFWTRTFSRAAPTTMESNIETDMCAIEEAAAPHPLSVANRVHSQDDDDTNSTAIMQDDLPIVCEEQQHLADDDTFEFRACREHEDPARSPPPPSAVHHFCAILQMAGPPLPILKFSTSSNKGLVSFGKQYQVLLATTFCAALVVYWTSYLALSATAMQLRENIIAGSMIFTIGDMGAQLLTFLVEARQQRTAARGASTKDTAGSSSTDTTADSTNTIFHFKLDQQRLVISTLLGALWAGIANPAVYHQVEQLLPGNASVGRVFLKMLISFSFLSTIGNYCTMFFRRWAQQLCTIWSMAFIGRHQQTKGQTGDCQGSVSFWTILSTRFRDCVSSCNRDMKNVFLDDMKVWPLYDILVYSVIPPAARPISNATMVSLWSMYMSIVSAAGGTKSDAIDKATENPLL